MDEREGTQITGQFLWACHRAILGGDNARSGADGRPLSLPSELNDAPPGVQAAHWGMACAVAFATGTALPPRPPGITEERAVEVVSMLSTIVPKHHNNQHYSLPESTQSALDAALRF